MASRIARMFGIDPLIVLDSDKNNWLIRQSAYHIAVEDVIKEQGST